jgi:hypothetical protein
MADLTDNSLVMQLLLLGLPPEDFAVFGSGPMMAHGIKEAHDLDVLARGAAWEKAARSAEILPGGFGGRKVAIGDIEIFDAWAPGEWDVDELIDTAEVIDGIRFVTLENVLKWKKLAARPKDAGHIRLIEEHLARRSEK